jgi:glycosyltransferase involved in cell wall biosynthesis
MASISVIIPAYNRAHLIGETLRSLFMQTNPED